VAGRRVALRHAPLTFLVLLVGSLIESFALAEGAAVLVRTGRLERDSVRRIYETATLVRALLLAGEERIGGRAHEALLRVRLLHAFVRRWVSTSRVNGRGWDEERYGVPVNQMDMIHTLLAFSHVVARGLGALGVKLGAEERASWCALWRLAGSVLGVDDALAFTDVNDERALYVRVRGHYRPDDGSRALASAVLHALAGAPPFFLPKRALEAIARRVMRDEMPGGDRGDELADAFGLARAPAWAVSSTMLAGAVRAADLVTRATPGAARVGVLSGWAFIELNRWRVLRSMPPADFTFRTA
jgi:hypothetical protein